MPWRDNTSRSGAVSRILAIVLVMMWSVVPVVCASATEIEPDHTHVGLGHDHDDGPVHKDQDTCCRSLASAQYLIAEPAALPPIKIVAVSVAPLLAVSDSSSAVVESEPVCASTGPPRTITTLSRFFTYSPLAPPARAV